MSRPFDVMIAGHLCLDVIPRFPDTGAKTIGEIMQPGRLVNVGEVGISTGGPVSNTGLNLRSLGQNVCFCARIGGDEFGQLTLQRLRRSGNADGIHVVEELGSSYTIVVAPPGIDRIFLHNPGTNDTFGPEDLDPQLIGRCSLFHFGYPPLMRRMYEDGGDNLRRIFEIAKEAGATTSCDMSLPDPTSPSGQADWPGILEKILPLIDLYLPSIEETFFMLERDEYLKLKEKVGDGEALDAVSAETYSRLAEKVLSMGPKIVALKSGHRGFYLRTAGEDAFDDFGEVRPKETANWAGRELWCPAFRIENLASATGSGDSSIAGLLAAFLRRLPIERALKIATCCGWQNLRELDAVSGMGSWEETLEYLRQGMDWIDPHIDGEGWVFSEEHGLWAGPNDPLARGS